MHCIIPKHLLKMTFLAAVVVVSLGAAPAPNPAIAFIDTNQRVLRVANADGSNSRIVASFPAGSMVRGPCWSPDGTQLVFYGSFASGHGLWIVNLDGTGLRQIVAFPPYGAGLYACTFPDWSRVPAADGQYKITFSMEGVQLPIPLVQHKRDIFIVNPDGTGLQNLTASASVSEYYSGWSTDGTRVFHSSNGFSLVGVDLAPVAGQLTVTGQNTLLTYPTGGGASYFAWIRSGPGGQLCFSNAVPNMRVFTFYPLVPAVPPLQVTTSTSSVSDRWASMAPDGARLAFERSGAIYTINANGTGQTRIIAQGSDPNWKR